MTGFFRVALAIFVIYALFDTAIGIIKKIIKRNRILDNKNVKVIELPKEQIKDAVELMEKEGKEKAKK